MRDGKPVVLYVEDDPDYREAIRAILEAADFEVVEAASAEEGLVAYRETRPDVVLVDLMMEEIDAGTSLVTGIRAAGGDVPIFMVSSVGDDLAMATDYGDLGLAGVFQKPVEAERLVSMIRARLEERGSGG